MKSRSATASSATSDGRTDHILEQPVQRQYPSGLLVHYLAGKGVARKRLAGKGLAGRTRRHTPNAGDSCLQVEFVQFSQAEGRDRTLARGRAVDATVMDAHEHAIAGHPHVTLHRIGSKPYRASR